MNRRGRAFLAATVVVSLALLTYTALRAQATRAADREIHSFFRDFAQGGATGVDKHLRYLAQRQEVANAIISRHREAIRNFDYSKFAPFLNVMLTRTVVPVSWDLNIVFSKRAGEWYISSFDEFVPDPDKAKENHWSKNRRVPFAHRLVGVADCRRDSTGGEFVKDSTLAELVGVGVLTRRRPARRRPTPG